MSEIEKIYRLLNKLKTIAGRSTASGRLEKALAAISCASFIQYHINQEYTDPVLENMVLQLEEKYPIKKYSKDEANENTILYYDGFGYDLRGNTLSVTSAIGSLGYKLVYVTITRSRENQPNLVRELSKYDTQFEYIEIDRGYKRWAEELNNVILKYKPAMSLCSTYPYDSAAVYVFNQYKDIIVRFFSDLTDHAFWLGINSFDYILNNRTIGQSIEKYYRGIQEEKQIRSISSLFVNRNIPFQGLPFDVKKHKYVFSGGSLYKTLGDADNTYYAIANYILGKYPDIYFVYAGDGDSSQFDILQAKYGDRAVLIKEREDFFQLIEGSLFFLNTYPMFGALMMRYSACANRIPLTLIHNKDADDNLLHQHELGIEFDSYESIIAEIDRLITDDSYRKAKEQNLKNAYYSREEFCDFYRNLLSEHISKYPNQYEMVDTSEFRKEYLNRVSYEKCKYFNMGNMRNYSLFSIFPEVFVVKIAKKARRGFK